MKQAWLVRSRPNNIERIKEFLEKNIIAIGWPGIGDLHGKSREDCKALLEGAPYRLRGLSLGQAYATIDLFVNQMQAGDLVLVPHGDDIYLGTIMSDYCYDGSVDNNAMGYPHQRQVTWLRNKGRQDLSAALRGSLRVPRTAADLSHHVTEIEALANGQAYHPENERKEELEVTYPLRPDFPITFRIPADMTQEEARRLSLYFSSLYFDASK